MIMETLGIKVQFWEMYQPYVICYQEESPY